MEEGWSCCKRSLKASALQQTPVLFSPLQATT